MTRRIRLALVLAALVIGLTLGAEETTQAAKWSVHVHGHFPGARAAYVYRHYGPPAHYGWRPRHYYPPLPYAPIAVHVYRAPIVVRVPSAEFYYGPLYPRRPTVRYRVW